MPDIGTTVEGKTLTLFEITPNNTILNKGDILIRPEVQGNSSFEDQERRTGAAMENLELKLLTMFEETSAVQSMKFAKLEQKMEEQERKMIEQERKMTALEWKITDQEKQITEQERKMAEIFKDLTLVKLGVTAHFPGLKSFLGNATTPTFIFIFFVMAMMANVELEE